MGYVYEVEKFRLKNGKLPVDKNDLIEWTSGLNRLENFQSGYLKYSGTSSGEYKLYYYDLYSGDSLHFLSNEIEGEYVFTPIAMKGSGRWGSLLIQNNETMLDIWIISIIIRFECVGE